MRTLPFRLLLLAIAFVSTVSTLTASESPRKAFAKKWEGRVVVVKQCLYSLVYNERGKLGNSRHTRRDGVTVVTPFEGIYYQFDGRQSRDDVIERDPQRIPAAVAEMYQGDSLDVRSYQRIEPLLIAQYDVGSELLVKDVRIHHDTVRLSFDQASGGSADDPVTALRIKWPVVLSESLTEQDVIENLIAKFVRVKPLTHAERKRAVPQTR